MATATAPAPTTAETSYKPLLAVQKPVPEDIVIAQSVQPRHISHIAAKLGLLPEEVDLYGTYKAKVTHASLHLMWTVGQCGRGVGVCGCQA